MMHCCQYKNHIVFAPLAAACFLPGSVLLVDCKQTLRKAERLVTFVQQIIWSGLNCVCHLIGSGILLLAWGI